MVDPRRSYFGTLNDFDFAKDCGHIRPAGKYDGDSTVLFWRFVVRGDKDATIYDGARVAFSVTNDGGRLANSVRSRRYGSIVYVHDTGWYGFIKPADGGALIYVSQTTAKFRLRICQMVEFLSTVDDVPEIVPEVMPQAYAYDVRSSRFGTVVLLDDTGRYGLIEPADGGEDIFFEQGNAMDRLRIFERVEFFVTGRRRNSYNMICLTEGIPHAYHVRTRRSGTVVVLDGTGGYGLIKPADGGENFLFFF